MDAPRGYRKKPIVVQAMRFMRSGSGTNGTAIVGWAKGKVAYYPDTVHGPKLGVDTREGTIYAVPGDYIVRGVQGEFYPVGGDIFHETYDEHW